MKQIYSKVMMLFLVFLIATTSFITQPMNTQAAELELDAESAILVDAETGKVLFAKNPDIALPPASMTKMMTEYLVLEAIDNGEISWETTTQISDYAYSISANPNFSGIGLKQDKSYTVKELYEAMAIISDNGTTIALAELVAGSEGEFVKRMNQKAEEMGLTDYTFVNSTGLDNEHLGDNYPEGTDPKGVDLMSSRDAALLAYHLVNDYPHALDISSQLTIEFEGHSDVNLNWMLKHDGVNLQQFYYEGMDGLKTGYTGLAGYTFTGTAERNGRRLITVVMRTESKAARFEQTARLLDYGFSQFSEQELFAKGYQLEDKETIPVSKGKEDTVDVSIAEGITLPVKSEEEELYSIEYSFDEDKLNDDGELIAPIEKGEKIGTATLVYSGDNDYGYIFGADNLTVDLVTDEAVEKANWFMLTLGAIGDFFSGIFSSIVDTVKGWFS
ncbi:D-alanyl-D-alanine carboxypeptidase family protein [Ornithinibacillus halotolerans]|uniref:serine-type D-Ala-D-Ala carboxypeptidase n=1 Tax=Ornithinibacillus halotolerans TaxID=1274357 RepID=A0A916RTM5_9BACI|nr:D-alanyl-D-alanine carboxypeptidase family protein [Ornithinibacillus halotolerans]GGA70581.1 D-alanyl-D-alanine carboxypeptidase DacA [Ornithinibacillus halotolerans]